MGRDLVDSPAAARSELPTEKSSPQWRYRHTHLPFDELTGTEFEIFCFLLLRAKYPNDRIYYYGKTSDMGRDIVHVSAEGHTRLIQCKNFARNVSPSEVAAEMAKVFINVDAAKIPVQPDEVVFFVSRDLSALSQDLVRYQEKWLEISDDLLARSVEEPSESLQHLAHNWWPFGDWQGGLVITEDAKTFCPALIDEFFAVRVVIGVSRDELLGDMRELMESVLGDPPRPENEGVQEAIALSRDELCQEFALASKPLSNWPQTIGDSHWIEREALDRLLDRIQSESGMSCVLLGEPGSGKSAFLAKLVSRLGELGITCLGIKGDVLAPDIDTLAKLAERLHLPATISDCINTLAADEPVVVLIDQLDALADLVDLKSNRLNVLLTLIHQIANRDNVFVVASCRTFEFRHDARFRTIDCEELHLSLPEWDVVAEMLDELEIDGRSWPDSFKEILRAPQSLKLFVEHFAGTTEQSVFATYQEMLEKLWYQKITRSEQAEVKSKLLAGLSAKMAENEVLRLPIAQFDGERSVIDSLIADGFLRLSETKCKLGSNTRLYSPMHERGRSPKEAWTFIASSLSDRTRFSCGQLSGVRLRISGVFLGKHTTTKCVDCVPPNYDFIYSIFSLIS